MDYLQNTKRDGEEEPWSCTVTNCTSRIPRWSRPDVRTSSTHASRLVEKPHHQCKLLNNKSTFCFLISMLWCLAEVAGPFAHCQGYSRALSQICHSSNDGCGHVILYLQLPRNRPQGIVFFPELVKKNNMATWPSICPDRTIHQRRLLDLRRLPILCSTVVIDFPRPRPWLA